MKGSDLGGGNPPKIPILQITESLSVRAKVLLGVAAGAYAFSRIPRD